MIDGVAKRVTGTCASSFTRAGYHVGRTSPNSLYNPKLATFEKDEVLQPSRCGRFIRLVGLRLARPGL
jgi:argininosuccinate synthase